MNIKNCSHSASHHREWGNAENLKNINNNEHGDTMFSLRSHNEKFTILNGAWHTLHIDYRIELSSTDISLWIVLQHTVVLLLCGFRCFVKLHLKSILWNLSLLDSVKKVRTCQLEYLVVIMKKILDFPSRRMIYLHLFFRLAASALWIIAVGKTETIKKITLQEAKICLRKVWNI